MIHVLAAVIRTGNRILIARRPDHVHQGGLWEFPGGKKEGPESREAALKRELIEEIGIEPTEYRPLIQVPHEYRDKSVLLDVWEVTSWRGIAHGKEGQPIQWVVIDGLRQYQFPQANLAIIKAVQLPSHYLITPAMNAGEAEFMAQLEASLSSGITLVQYRQKNLHGEIFANLATKVIRCCHEAGARVLLNSSPELVQALGADGVQLNAHDLMAMAHRPLPEPYLVGASCHNESELIHAGKLGLDFALLSPVQKTATHPDAVPLGWQDFADLVRNASVPVYALGGVSREDVSKAWECGGQGVSAISALWGSINN
jgi:8-oxo-dGTP diphosphatase